MEAIVGGGGGGEGGDGGSIDGSSSGGSVSTLSKEELAVEQRKSNKINNVGLSNFEVSSYPDDQDDELELGLGLSLGVGGSCSKGGVVASKQQQAPRILTAKDLASRISLSMPSSARPINGNSSTASPSSASSSSSIGGRVHNDNKGSIGTKRTADSVNSPSGASGQAVGWPPVGAYRMNSMANQTKTIGTGEVITKIDQSQGKGVVYGASTNDIKGDATNHGETGGGHLKGSLFVKVNMYGVGIGRKVDLSAHSSYESLGRKLEEMFNIPTRTVGNLDGEEHGTICSAVAPSELLDGSSEFVLTYEDKDGDWMLVGDVPWGMFLSSVKRLRIMKTSEARGLAPRCEERNAKQRTRLV